MSTFGRFPTWANSVLRGKFTAVAALVELVCLMDNKTNRIRVSHDRLAQRMGCSVSTAKRAIDMVTARSAARGLASDNVNDKLLSLKEAMNAGQVVTRQQT